MVTHRPFHGEHIDHIPPYITEVRNTVVARLQKNQPILVPAKGSFGDDFLRYRAHYVVLKKFCDQKGISFNEKDPPLLLSDLNKQTPGYAPWSFADTYMHPFHQARNVQSKYARNVTMLSHLLGVEIDEKELSALPLPIKMNTGPLQHVDPAKMIQRSADLSSEHPNQQQIVLVQAGSSKWKRYSDEQTQQLIAASRETFPNSFVTLVTDKVFLPHQNLEEIPDLGADAVIRSTDINEIGAHGAIRDAVIITTDTFLAWFLAGCQGLLPQNNNTLPQNTLIELYTVADPHTWHIPGAYVVESQELTDARKAQQLTDDGYLPDEAAPYKQYSGITPRDINKVKDAIRSVAEERHHALRRAS